ncbi:MAG: flagellar biosynthesis protein FlgH [Deltaproteobacteria bacterium HGW-Deltaproteobacteria-10]|nr:MAG: flagellar biosynthesis protein FlgH [Deltaproteobacteria bacterium HGW-Deltaproteobacteria-10]
MFKIKQIYSVLVLILAVFVVTGCLPAKKEVVRPDTNISVPPTVKAQPASGSIWAGESANNLICSGKKARYANDIVTIIISETAAGGNKASTNTSKDTSTSAAITSLLGIENAIIGSNASMGGKIGLGGTSTNALKGEGDTSRSSTLSASISARVLKVLDNGNLLIEGKRQLTVNAEDQFIIISGIIRPDDITASNTVASQYIADARIFYTGDGVINDKMRPGWLTRMVDWVWPF